MSSVALGPNTTPAGLRKKRSAPVMVERSAPSMSERSPPVTRVITFAIPAGPENVARSPAWSEKPLEAVKEVGVLGAAECGADLEVRPQKRAFGSQRAVEHNLPVCPRRAGNGRHQRRTALAPGSERASLSTRRPAPPRAAVAGWVLKPTIDHRRRAAHGPD